MPGSNMCTGRLQQRVPSARPIAVAKLLNNSLRFHKRSDKDGSEKRTPTSRVSGRIMKAGTKPGHSQIREIGRPRTTRN